MVKIIRLDEQIDDRSRRDCLLGIAKDYFLSTAIKTGNKPNVGSSYCEGDDSYGFFVHYKPDSDTNVTISVRPLRNQVIVEFPKILVMQLS